MSETVITKSSRSIAYLFGATAIAIVLAAPAHAEVMIDQQQLTGQGKTIADQAYSDARQVRSPFGGAAAMPVLSNEPIVITSRGSGPESSLAVSAKAPIALKPLPKWGLAAPAAPISTGGRTAILLKPPGNANHVINQLAAQSPLRAPAQQFADNAPMRLRPPAPIPPQSPAYLPPAPQFAQAQNNQMMAAPPMPSTQVAMPVAAAPAPQANVQMAMNNVPAAVAPAPVSQLGELRAEDVVALDFGGGTSGTPVKAMPASAPSAPPAPKTESLKPVAAPPPAAPVEESEPSSDTLPEVPKFMPPLDDAPAEVKTSEVNPAPVQTASAEPQFMSPLTEGLPTDEDSSSDTSSQLAMTAPTAPLREAKREEPQIDTSKKTETLEPEMPKENKLASSGAQKLIDPKADVAAKHASADQAADEVAESLKAPAEKQNKPVPVAVAEKPKEIIVNAADIEWSGERAAVIEDTEAKARFIAAMEEKAAAEKAKQEAEKLAALEAEKAEAARKQAEIEAKAFAEAKAKEEAEAKALAEAKAKEQAIADAKAKEEAEKLAKAQAEADAKALAEAKAKEEAEAKALAEVMAKEQAIADARAKKEAEELAMAQAEAEKQATLEAEKAEIARKQAEADARTAKLAAESRAKAQALAEAKAKEETEKLVAQERAIAEAEAQRLAKAEAEAAAVKQAEETAAREAEKAAAETELADAKMKMRAAPTKPIERVNVLEESKISPRAGAQEAALTSGAMLDAGKAMAETAPLVQKTVLFQSGVSALPSDASAAVNELAQQMKNNREAKIILSAYADGSSQAGAAARRLSLQRAILMRDALNKQGVPISRVEVKAQTAAPDEINPDRVDVTVQ